MADSNATPFELPAVGVGDAALIQIKATRADGITPINLTGATVRFAVGTPGGAKPIDKTSAGAGGVTITDALGGLAVVQVTGADTTAAGANQGHACAVRITEADGTPTTRRGTWPIFDHALR